MRRIHLLLWTIFFVLIEFRGYSCGPDWPVAVFVKQHGPDAPYGAFVSGRLGVPQSGYRTRHLVVIYRYLIDRPLSGAEQDAAIKANDHFISNWVTVFLTPADREEAAKEIAELRTIPKAANYLSVEALAWQRAYPDDPRAPELIGQAFRVLRNACTDKSSSEMEHRLFLVLHRQYPRDHWTLRYRTWE